MIEFACQCGQRFKVLDDEAGAMVQCPKCRRLVDVPTHDDLKSLRADGTYVVHAELQPKPDALPEIFKAFSRDTYDLDGTEKDLRPTPRDLAPPQEIPLAGPESPRQQPRYDPETGELLRAIPIIAPTAPTQPHAPAPKRVISYATVNVTPRMSAARLLLELLQPANIIVLAFALLFHLFWFFICFAFLVLPFLAALPLLLMTVVILAHYGVTIDETGREARDELPRPLRYLNWNDDIWGPFANVLVALLLCYGIPLYLSAQDVLPPSLRLWPRDAVDPRKLMGWATALAIIGTLVFPAMLLTLTSSGSSIINLRPDRIIGTIVVCGGRYLLALFNWALSLTLFTSALCGPAIVFRGRVAAFLAGHRFAASFIALCLGVYWAHFFCWHIGLLYRGLHDRFPWALQRHVREAKEGEKRQGETGTKGQRELGARTRSR